MKERFISHGPCIECGSRDGVGYYADGHGYCFVCTKYYSGKDKENGNNRILSDNLHNSSRGTTSLTPITTVFREIPRRGLPEEAIRKYQIDVCMDKSVDIARRYPYFKNGIHTANKIRQRTKKGFWFEGDEDGTGLFGQQLFPAGGRAITVTEGEDDAASAWVLLGSRYPCVSVKSSSRAVEDCRASFEYLNSFEEIVLCFDKDEPHKRPDGSVFFPGQEAAKAVAELFAPGKCRIMELQEGKDANEYLQKGIPHKDFVNEWYRAKKFMPDGLVFGHDLWPSIIDAPKPYCVPTGIKGVDSLIYGLRLGEMVTFTADPKIGKTTVLKTIEYALLMHPELREKNYGVGFMHLEEPKQDLAVGLMGLACRETT
jgi:twinkle protein